MKTTVDLPDALVNEIQRRAVSEGREVKVVVADLLTASLSGNPFTSETRTPAAKTLPLIKARPLQTTEANKLTAEEWCDWIKGAILPIR